MIILYTLKLNKVFHRIPNFNLIDSLFFFFLFLVLLCFVFETGSCYVTLAALELTDPPAPDSQVLRLKVPTTILSYNNPCTHIFHGLYLAASPECVHGLHTHCPEILLPKLQKTPGG